MKNYTQYVVTTALAFVTSTVAISDAYAQNNAALAEQLFNDGKKLMSEKAYEKACPKFAESARLDPAGPTLFFLAECLELEGKSASAWTKWREARDYAVSKNKNDKAIEAEKRANALEPKVPKLRIELPAGILQLKGLEIRLDGELIQSAAVGSTLPHDPGDASLELSAPKKKPAKVVKKMDPGKTTVLSINELESTEPSIVQPISKDDRPGPAHSASSSQPTPHPDKPPPAPSQPDTTGNTQRILGLVSGGVGLAGVAVGGIFMGMAVSTQNEIKTDAASNKCGTDNCASLRETRDSQRTAGVIGFVAGGAFLVGGVVLYLTAPKRQSAWVQPHVRIASDPVGGGGSVVFGGNWLATGLQYLLTPLAAELLALGVERVPLIPGYDRIDGALVPQQALAWLHEHARTVMSNTDPAMEGFSEVFKKLWEKMTPRVSRRVDAVGASSHSPWQRYTRTTTSWARYSHRIAGHAH